jgi:hypothetical protein
MAFSLAIHNNEFIRHDLYLVLWGWGYSTLQLLIIIKLIKWWYLFLLKASVKYLDVLFTWTKLLQGGQTYVIHLGIFYRKLYNGGNFSTIWQNKTHYTPVSRRAVSCDWVWRSGVHTGFCTITLVLYIGSLPNLATWFPGGRGRTLFILGSLGQRSRSPLL